MQEFTELNDIPPVTRFITFRTLVTATALVASAMSIWMVNSAEQMSVVTAISLLIALPIAAIYGVTSNLPGKRRTLLGIQYYATFSVFVICLSLSALLRFDLQKFHESKHWSPLPPETVAVPLMWAAIITACIFAYATLRYSNVLDKPDD